jgi:hypothetical protein
MSVGVGGLEAARQRGAGGGDAADSEAAGLGQDEVPQPPFVLRSGQHTALSVS